MNLARPTPKWLKPHLDDPYVSIVYAKARMSWENYMDGYEPGLQQYSDTLRYLWRLTQDRKEIGHES